LRFTPTKTFPVERFQRESAPISTAARARFRRRVFSAGSHPVPHHHTHRNQCSPHRIGCDLEPLAKLRQCLTAAVQLGGDRKVIVDKSLVPHRHTMLMQELDNTALTKLVTLSELRRRSTILVGLHQFGDGFDR